MSGPEVVGRFALAFRRTTGWGMNPWRWVTSRPSFSNGSRAWIAEIVSSVSRPHRSGRHSSRAIPWLLNPLGEVV